MSLRDTSVTTALNAARDLVHVAAETAVGAVANSLSLLMRSAGTYRERGQLAYAQTHILQNQKVYLSAFAAALRDRVDEDTGPKSQAQPPHQNTDWQSVSLVDEDQIDERISFERIGQLITHNCEAELRELAGYMSGLLRHGWADPDRNPLRGEVLGSAVHLAIEKIAVEPATQGIFARELGKAMADAMPMCYREIVADLKRRAVRPVDLAVRPVEGFAARAGSGAGFDEARKAWELSWQGRPVADPGETLRSWETSILGRFGNADAPADGHDPESSASLLDRLIRGGLPGSFGSPRPASPSPATAAADDEIMNLLRRLNGGASHRGEFDASPRDTGHGPATGQAERERRPTGRRATDGPAPKNYYAQPPSSGLSGLMAANLIRAHREELMQASRGKLDHLVIEVVSSLFDQILSDARVPPQMARQIARLQLPVLRVALNDASFFSSRRHPVRRFINRAASLACAFDDLDAGPGSQLLARVSQLVAEIVDGDFDQVELYDAQLLELERFTAEQTHAEVREGPAAETLRGKELEWHVQQRFSWRLHAALEPLALPGFVREFLSGVWGEAIVFASRRDGPGAAYPQQLRRSGAELVTSIQPKRTIEQRKHFLATLPTLMAELTNGMKLVEWPKALQDDFFGQLITQHAGSLKTAPLSELDQNMMVRHLETAFSTPIPSAEEARTEAPPAGAPANAVEQHFSPEEQQTLGLISESAVDWAGAVEPEAGVDAPAAASASVPAAGSTGALPAASVASAGSPKSAEDSAKSMAAPRELATGPQLRDHLQLGFSYRLNLKDDWEKVRLTYMSPGRSLFLFSHGAKNRQTISMTARTLGRLCETGRMRAFENDFLVDRATQRARQQLATLDKAAPAGIRAANRLQ